MNSSYRDSGRQWAIVAGDNYGEGSSREAAALSPRYMGGFAVIARSMARIHETVSSDCEHKLTTELEEAGTATIVLQRSSRL